MAKLVHLKVFFLYPEVVMPSRQKLLATALGLGLAANLSAGENAPGFQWIGPRAGTVFFAPSNELGSLLPMGGQAGLVFDGRRYGLSLEAFQYFASDPRLPDVKIRRRGVSATFLSGLSEDPAGSLWPYLGLGLGAINLPDVDPATLSRTSRRTSEIHAALGFLQRPAGRLFWGLEGRSIFRFPLKSLHEIQANVLLGLTWGGRPAAPPAASAPEAPAREYQAPMDPPRPQASPVSAPAPAPSASATASSARTGAAPASAPSTSPVSATPMIGAALALPTPAGAATASASTPIAPVAVPAESAPEAGAALPKASATGPDGGGRLEALRRGDIPRALDLSRAYIESLPPHHWTLRLEAAWLSVTLKNAACAYPGQPDLFIAPLQLRDGRSVHQLFLGDFTSKTEAERALRSVPGYFAKVRPRPFPILLAALPTRACPMTRPVPRPRPASTPAPKGIPVRPVSACTRCHQ